MFVLTHHTTIANQFVFELRDAAVQGDRLRFRKNMERLGQIMAFEISRTLHYSEAMANTPLGTSRMQVPGEMPVLITILRAGLPFFQGFIDFFDRSECGFIGAFRKEDEQHMTIRLEYVATTSLADRTVILIDPMLATGRSVVDSVTAMMKNGTPRYIHVASLVSAPEGVAYLKEHLKVPFTLWTCALDDHLNQQLYIVPGLGDAGDLSFGPKL